MTLAPEDLLQIVDDVLSSFAGETSSVDEPPAADGARAGVTAGIHVSGAWNGSVMLSCSTAYAYAVAAAMLDVAADEVTDADVSDAIGEVANMIGGSVKALMPEPSVLSLPMVTFDARSAVVPGTDLLQSVDLEPLGRALKISVLQRRSAT